MTSHRTGGSFAKACGSRPVWNVWIADVRVSPAGQAMLALFLLRSPDFWGLLLSFCPDNRPQFFHAAQQPLALASDAVALELAVAGGRPQSLARGAG